ncbi:MAG: hypothetical protein AAGF74_02265 [Pseudomonadota bacterium]
MKKAIAAICLAGALTACAGSPEDAQRTAVAQQETLFLVKNGYEFFGHSVGEHGPYAMFVKPEGNRLWVQTYFSAGFKVASYVDINCGAGTYVITAGGEKSDTRRIRDSQPGSSIRGMGNLVCA